MSGECISKSSIFICISCGKNLNQRLKLTTDKTTNTHDKNNVSPDHTIRVHENKSIKMPKKGWKEED